MAVPFFVFVRLWQGKREEEEDFIYFLPPFFRSGAIIRGVLKRSSQQQRRDRLILPLFLLGDIDPLTTTVYRFGWRQAKQLL